RDVLAREPVDESLGPFLAAFDLGPPGGQVHVTREATVRANLEALLGLYVPHDRAIYMRARAHPAAGETADEILVHELIHAAQDDHFGFAKMENVAGVPTDELL